MRLQGRKLVHIFAQWQVYRLGKLRDFHYTRLLVIKIFIIQLDILTRNIKKKISHRRLINLKYKEKKFAQKINSKMRLKHINQVKAGRSVYKQKGRKNIESI
jgi:hypothetical protein